MTPHNQTTGFALRLSNRHYFVFPRVSREIEMQETLMLNFKGDAVPFAYQVPLETYLRFSYLQDGVLIDKNTILKGISDHNTRL